MEWCGLVESKIRLLVGNLERNQHISLAHVNPKCFDIYRQKGSQNASTNNCDENSSNPSDENSKPIAPFCSMWFIGLEFERMENLNVDLTDSIQSFTAQVHSHAVSIVLFVLRTACISGLSAIVNIGSNTEFQSFTGKHKNVKDGNAN